MNKYLYVKERFEEIQNIEKASAMAKYMRNLFSFFGIATAQRKEIYKNILKEDKKNKIIDWKFLDTCYADEHREFQYLVTDYLNTLHSFLQFEDIEKITCYIKIKQWWDTIDSFDQVIGEIGLKDQRVDTLMLEWSSSQDIWMRRIAIDHQLCRKEKTNARLLGNIIEQNLGSNEFFINKAIGWSLREYSKTNPEWVRQFIVHHEENMNTLSIREASKYLV